MADFHFQHNFLYFIFNVSELSFVRNMYSKDDDEDELDDNDDFCKINKVYFPCRILAVPGYGVWSWYLLFPLLLSGSQDGSSSVRPSLLHPQLGHPTPRPSLSKHLVHLHCQVTDTVDDNVDDSNGDDVSDS